MKDFYGHEITTDTKSKDPQPVPIEKSLWTHTPTGEIVQVVRVTQGGDGGTRVTVCDPNLAAETPYECGVTIEVFRRDYRAVNDLTEEHKIHHAVGDDYVGPNNIRWRLIKFDQATGWPVLRQVDAFGAFASKSIPVEPNEFKSRWSPCAGREEKKVTKPKEIVLGSVVKLHSGGPKMTVEAWGTDPMTIQVHVVYALDWGEAGNVLYRSLLPLTCLRLYDPDENE